MVESLSARGVKQFSKRRISVIISSIFLIALLSGVLGYTLAEQQSFMPPNIALDDFQSAASFVIKTDGNSDYWAVAPNGSICFESSNCSYIANSVIQALGVDGGLIHFAKGLYTLTNSIVVHGGVRITGEGIHKEINQTGTTLQLASGAIIPLILENSTINQYFFTISDLELLGSSTEGFLNGGDINVEKSTIGIMLTNSFSDYSIQNVFVHNFYCDIYLDQYGWYGRVLNCWIESAIYGIFVKHQQFIISDSNLSGLGTGIEFFKSATDVIVTSNHIFSETSYGVYFEMRNAGHYNFLFGDNQFVDNGIASIMAYAYSNVNLNISISDSQIGQDHQNTQQNGIETWTTGTGSITLSVDNTAFFPVTRQWYTGISGSTNATYAKFGETNSGFVTENSGSLIGTGSQQTIPHGCSGVPTIVILSNGNGIANAYQSSNADATNIYITADNGVSYFWLVQYKP